MAVSPFEVERYLAGVEYPVSRVQLVDTARENGAPNEVIGVLERLPAESIDSPEDLVSLFGDITGEEDEANLLSDEALGEIGEGDEQHYFHNEG